MTKSEFFKKIQKEKLNISPWNIEFDRFNRVPYFMGCVKEDDYWKIFKTADRGDYYVIKEFKTEHEAFDYIEV